MMKKIFIKLIIALSFFGLMFGQVENIGARELIGKDMLNDIKNGSQELNDVTALRSKVNDIVDNIVKLIFLLALIYFFIIAIKLIVNPNSEEEAEKFKKGLIWISVGLIVTKIAEAFIDNIFLETSINKPEEGSNLSQIEKISNSIVNNIILPLSDFLATAAAFVFIFMAIFLFFKLITSNGDESARKTTIRMIIYSIIGFILIKVASKLVNAVYGGCKTNQIGTTNQLAIGCAIRNPEQTGVVSIIIQIMNWINSFIGIGIVVMIIFAGFQIIFSSGEEEKLNKGKKTIIFIAIGLIILVANYLILRFVLDIPNS